MGGLAVTIIGHDADLDRRGIIDSRDCPFVHQTDVLQNGCLSRCCDLDLIPGHGYVVLSLGPFDLDGVVFSGIDSDGLAADPAGQE